MATWWDRGAVVGKLLMVIAALGLQIYALVDIARTRSDDVRTLPKPIWILVWLVPVAGPVAWLALGRPQVGPASGGGPSGPGSLGGPRRPRGPSAPDDDPEFLRSLDERSWSERMERLRRERGEGAPGTPGDSQEPPPAAPEPTSGPAQGERPTESPH